jgi:hypothetical protein
MDVLISTKIPAQFAKMRGLTYETRYLYTGFGRYNEHEKTLEVFQRDKDGKTTFFSRPFVLQVLSRVYHTELVRVNVYSNNPRIWTEDVGEGNLFFQLTNRNRSG